MPTTRIIYDLVGRDNASRAFDTAGASATRAERTFSKVGKALVVGAAGIAAGAVAIGYESTKAAVKFQSSMTKISTQAGGTKKDVQALSKEVLALGGKVQQSPQELADSLYHLKSVGLDNVKAMKALRAASDLAAVGGANLEETTNAVAGAWRSGIKGAGSFQQAAATVNATIGAGNMRMEDFINAIGTGILPSAKSFGVSMKSVGAALALMTDEGIPAQNAATRLRMSLSLLGAPSDKAETALKSIGVTGLKLAQAMRSPGGIVAAIGLLKQHLDASGLSASKQAILLSHAFGGGRSSSGILTLLNNYSVLQKKQDQINRSIGKFGPAVAQQKKTAEAQLKLLESSLETMGIKIGMFLIGPLTKFVGFLNKVVVPAGISVAHAVARAFSSIIPVGKIKAEWHKLMRTLGLEKPPPVKLPAFEPGTIRRSKKIPLFAASGATPGMGGMPAQAPAQSMASKLGDALSKVNWGQVLASAAGAIGHAFGTILGKIDWAGLGKTAAFDAVPFAIGFVNNIVGAIINEAVHHPVDMLEFILALIPIGRAATIAEKVLGEIPLLGPIVKMFTKPLTAAGRIVERFLGKILGKIFGPIKNKIGGYFADGVSWLRGKGDSIILGLWYGFERAWRVVTRFLGKIFGSVLRYFGKAGSWLLSKGGDIIQGLWNGFLRLWPRVTGWIGKIGSKVIGFFKSAGRWLLNAGGRIIEGLLGGIRAKMAGIASWIKGNIVDPVVNWVKHFFGIHSPSTVFHGLGMNMIEGLMHGLMSHDLTGFVGKVFGSVPKALGSIVGKGLVSLESLPGKALSALGKLGGFLGGIFGHLFGGGGGGGVQQWAGTVLKVLSMLGQPASALPIVLSQMMTESGGRVNAINLTDSNAKAGIPSQGLMQVIPPTFAAYAGPFRGLGILNPLANIYAGLNYAIHRYGRTGWMSVLGHGHGYAAGTGAGGAAKGLAMVGENGPELMMMKGGETVWNAQDTAGIMGYAKGTKNSKRKHKGPTLAQIGARLFHESRHKRVINDAIDNSRRRMNQELSLAKAPGLGPARRRHYRKMAEADAKRLHHLRHVRKAEEAYRTQLQHRAAQLKETVKAARHRHLHRVAALAEKRLKRHQRIIHGIDLWLNGPPHHKAKPKPKPKKAPPPTGNMTIEDWAAYLSALSGGGLPAFASGTSFVPATGPAIVHRGEMILPEDVAEAVRNGSGGGGNFTGNLYLSTGELLGVIDGRIERSDRTHNRRVRAGTGRH